MPLDSQPSSPLLSVRNLNICFGSNQAVRGLDFTIDAGETLALVGESGCGKSATALSMMRLLPPGGRVTDGEILFLNHNIETLRDREMAALRGGSIAMVFQEPMTSLNPVLSIGRQITEAIRRHEPLSARAARARAIELLNLVRIPAPERRIDDYPHKLSGGMRQRVMIAMAVACRPKLLIADEPTTALDVTVQAQVLELLNRLRQELSMGLLLITHDLGLVADWADRVVVMYAGRICERAPVETLFQAPVHPYTRGLIGCSPRVDASLHFRQGPLPEISGSVASAAGVAGCPFAPRCASAVPSCWTSRPEALAVTGRNHFVACPVHARTVVEHEFAYG
jgi:peptide/nickel transport system ATP-binding protein